MVKRIRVIINDGNIQNHLLDIETIRNAIRDRGQYWATKEQAYTMWRECSESWNTPWLDPSIYTKKGLYDMIRFYFEEA